ncbi:MAG: hypothetical protein HZB25_04470 [Candidatus Eisenbacteria bacterium]|nr:hypothetical protein [Candidatus Eisenbacteria bacterium]
MQNKNTWKFVTPSFVASKKFKGIKTPNQVKKFAVKNDVFCGWFKNTGSKTKHFLVEFTSFQKAYKNNTPTFGKITKITKTAAKAYGKKTSVKKTYKASTKPHRGFTRNYSRNYTKTYSRRAA